MAKITKIFNRSKIPKHTLKRWDNLLSGFGWRSVVVDELDKENKKKEVNEMERKMNLEQKREYFLTRLIGQLRIISKYEQNDKYMEKLFKKTEIKFRKAQKKFYKNKRKEK